MRRPLTPNPVKAASPMWAPAVTLGDLWPPESVVVPRMADDSVDWLPPDPVWRERASAGPLLLAGSLPIICHAAAATPGALGLFRACALQLPPEIIPYRDLEQMRRLVEAQVARGRRIGITYTSHRAWTGAESHVTPPALLADLNDKANLASLLPEGAAPERQVVSAAEWPDELDRLRGQLPVVLKASSRLGSGAGFDVAICRTPDDLEAARSRLGRAERLVVETYHRFTTTWCAHYAVGVDRVGYLGSAEQICDAAGRYHGNWCEHRPDAGASGPGKVAIGFGLHAAEAARSRGYRGFLGVDVGSTDDGRWLAFDLNFRTNGSTLQVVLRDRVASAWGARCTRVCHGVRFRGKMEALLERLWSFYSERMLLPLLAFDTAQLGADDPRPISNLLIAGRDRPAVEAAAGALRAAGFEIEPASS